jgi:hypothetical protein
MPQVRLLRLLSMDPPRAGTTYAYLSWLAPIVELDHLPGKPEDEPCMHGIIALPVGTQLTS